MNPTAQFRQDAKTEHPTKTHPILKMIDDNNKVVIQVFQYMPTTGLWNVNVYWDEEYQRNRSMKELSIQDARKWWNTLVEKGYNRK